MNPASCNCRCRLHGKKYKINGQNISVNANVKKPLK